MRMPGGANEEQLTVRETDIGYAIPEDFNDFLRLYNKAYRVAFFEYLAFDIRRIRKQRDGLNVQLAVGVVDDAELFPDVDQVRTRGISLAVLVSHPLNSHKKRTHNGFLSVS